MALPINPEKVDAAEAAAKFVAVPVTYSEPGRTTHYAANGHAVIELRKLCITG